MRKPHIHIFQHDAAVGAGHIADWISRNRLPVTYTRFFNDDPLPDVNQLDWLIVLGGDMGVFDYDRFPWLYEEKRCIEKAIGINKVVLGICLGAQIIAEVLGTRVYKTRFPEIGWFEVEVPKEAAKSPIIADIQRKFMAFHWHEDTFDLPSGAIRLGSTKACLNQGFIHDDRVVGIQFHPECRAEEVRVLIEQFRHEFIDGIYVQSPEAILSAQHHYTQMHAALDQILDNILNRVVQSELMPA
jgi:GMP synthase-like glutamine amidotransferase